MNFKRYLLALSALFFLTAGTGVFSSWEKGNTGPAVPQGIPRDSGINDSINIIIATTCTVSTTIFGTDTSSTWLPTSTPTFHWAANFIDTFILTSKSNVVEVYWSTLNGAGWDALPVTSLLNQGDEMSYRYNDDSISLTYYTGGAPYIKYPGYPATSPQFKIMLFKVIVIPPRVQLNYPGVDWKDASEVALLPLVKEALKRP